MVDVTGYSFSDGIQPKREEVSTSAIGEPSDP